MGIGKKQKNGEKITLVPSTGITETGISFKILCYLPEIPEEAISMKTIKKKNFDREVILDEILEELGKKLEELYTTGTVK